MTNATPASKWSPEFTPELRNALAAAEQAGAEAAKIDTAITTTREQLATANAELEHARATLAASESETALTGGQADRQARKALVAARDEAEFISARLAGLEARKRSATATVIETRRDVAIRWRNWQRSLTTEYIDRVYVPALDQFVAAIRGITAVAQALGSNRLQAIARDTVLRDPRDWERNPCNPRRSNWRSDPEAGNLYEHLLKLRAVVAPNLEGFEDGLTSVPTETPDEQPV